MWWVISGYRLGEVAVNFQNIWLHKIVERFTRCKVAGVDERAASSKVKIPKCSGGGRNEEKCL